MASFTDDDLYEKRRRVLQNIAIAIYVIIFIAQIAMFFVMHFAGLILQSTDVFIKEYMIRPIGMNTLILCIGTFVIHKCKDIQIKNLMEILKITLMIACIAYVHHVFSILLIGFCVPIFLSVTLQDKRILNITTFIGVVDTILVSLDCYLNKNGASDDTYFIPTVVIIIFVLIACRFAAAMSIKILKEKEESLVDARNEAEASNRSKSIFLSNMSHEIRTPINAILGLDTMILRESKEEDIRNYALDIRNSGQTLLSLINDILDLSKIESGKMELVEGEYDFASVIHDVMNMISIKAEQKHLALNLKLDENLPSRLYGDDVRIRQILINIMNNAVKYTEEGSVTLSISGEKNEQEVLLHFSVKDTGIGIKEEDMHKLFGKYDRIEEKRNKNIEGTGLGMSITAAFLALMNSELKVNSVYGKGSEFYFDIKQKILNAEPIGELESRITNKIDEKDLKLSFTAPDAHILVVDDNAMNRKVFMGLLKKTKLKIDEAESGKECINLCRNNKYDIVFLDHMMPEMDGVETLKHMKGLEEFVNADTPMIVLTANAISGAKEEYLKAGFNDYLTKPINPEKLEKMIVRYLPKELVKEGISIKEMTEPESNADNANDLPEIAGINWGYALQIMKDKDLLVSTVESFAKLGKKNSTDLKNLYENILKSNEDNSSEAFKEYRILVHSMKSSAAMIGICGISEVAKWLEYAARDENLSEIKNLTEYFLEHWDAYVEQLREKFLTDEGKKSVNNENIKEIKNLLEKLENASAKLDMDTMDEVSEQLEMYEFSSDDQALIDEIIAAIVELNCDKVVELSTRFRTSIDE